VIVSARASRDLDQMAQRISSDHDVRAVAVPAELDTSDGVERLAREAWEVFDGLDILINNAGISLPESTHAVSAKAWDLTMAVNLRAPALLGARIGNRMAENGGGRIVNVGSTAGLRALADHYAYAASKAALTMATKVLATELGPRGVRANTVSPTVILTEMGERVWGEESRAAPMLAHIPVGHFGVPDDVANAVLYLGSPGAGMVNGIELVVDGGFTAV